MSATPPGSTWRYSGLGFVLLQEALERTSRQSIDALLEQAVTGPLHMSSTSFSDSGGMTIAKGHDRLGRERSPAAGTPPNAASSLRTSVVDYARFVERMFADLAGGPGASTAGRLMVQPRVQVDAALGLSWGLGWGLAKAESETLFLQWGSNPGYKSLVVASIDRLKALVVLTNGDNGLELATGLVPAVFGREYPFLQFYMLHPDD